MPTARVNGIELYYEVDGEGPTVVFCHGVGGNHMSWWQQVPEFSQRFRCVTFDHRGFALSPNTTRSGRTLWRRGSDAVGAEAFSTDLAELLDHLGAQEVFLVGQSMGGRTILNFAKRSPHRVKAMVMAATIANIRTEELDKLRREVSQGLPEDRLEVALAPRVWEERPQLAYLFKLIRARNPARPPKFLWRDNVPGTTAEDLAALATPTLFLVGEEDRISPPHVVEVAYKLFPNANMVRVPQAGHSVYFERPTVFNPIVMEFFGSQT